MFLIWGVGDQRSEIAFDQWMDCPNCRQEAQIRIWKLQTSLNIFFYSDISLEYPLLCAMRLLRESDPAER